MEQTINYKGYRIRVVQDERYDSPDNWNNERAFLVYDHRIFQVEVKGFNPIDISNHLANKPGDEDFDEYNREQFNDYYIFPVEAYIHSGISLSLFNGTKQDKWDSSVKGFVLVAKKNELMQGTEFVTKSMAEERAKGLIETWNQYLHGEVYGYIVEKPEIIYSITKDKFDRLVFESDLANIESEFEEDTNWLIVNSCWGYYGSPEESGCIEDAKSLIDNL